MLRTTRRIRRVLLAGFVAVLTALTGLTVWAATVSNGGFETGDLTGWTVVVQGGPETGSSTTARRHH